MRLIDADALVEALRKYQYPYGVEALVRCQPTIEAEPVRHGRWGNPIKVDADNNGYKCSECGEFGAPCWNYCPNCGAKMDVTDIYVGNKGGDSHAD